MSKSRETIRIHPKYGVNPSIGICFWCGEQTGEIILFGGELKDEAPREVCVSYLPCNECAEKWGQGFLLIEASKTPLEEGQPPMSQGAYPTGNYIVLSYTAARRLFGWEYTEKGIAFIDIEAFQKLLENVQEPSKEDGQEL